MGRTAVYIYRGGGGGGVIESHYLPTNFFTETIQLTESSMLTSPVPSHTVLHQARYPNWDVKITLTVAEALDHSSCLNSLQ